MAQILYSNYTEAIVKPFVQHTENIIQGHSKYLDVFDSDAVDTFIFEL